LSINLQLLTVNVIVIHDQNRGTLKRTEEDIEMKRMRKIVDFARQWPTVSQAVLYRRVWQSWGGMPGGLAIGLTLSGIAAHDVPLVVILPAWVPIIVMALLRYEPRMRRQLRVVDAARRAILDIGNPSWVDAEAASATIEEPPAS